MKVCTKCGIEKDKSDFFRDARLSDGLQARCKPCMRVATAESIRKNPEKRLIRERRSRLKNPKRSTKYVRAWRKKHPEKYAASNAATEAKREYDRFRYASDPRRKDSVNRRSRECARRNPEREWARTVRRRAALLNRNVSWASPQKIKLIYAEAKRIEAETGVPHQVDHIIPLRGKKVSGLHWEGNLQVLPRIENIRKGNKLTEDSHD